MCKRRCPAVHFVFDGGTKSLSLPYQYQAIHCWMPIGRRREVAKSSAVSPDKGGKQPELVGLVVERRLRDCPRVRRPWVIILQVRLRRWLRQWRRETTLA